MTRRKQIALNREHPDPGPFPVEALRYFEAKGLRPAFDYDEVWKEEHNVAFTVAKVMEESVLEDMRGIIRDAIEDGTTFEKFQQDAAKALAQSGWMEYGGTAPHRLRTIYATNMRVARGAGQWERMERTKKARPFIRYGRSSSDDRRDEHAQWEGLVLPVDHPFWDEHMPPNGWGCECPVRQLSERQAARYGGQSEDPEIERVPHYNKKTGKVEYVPEGIDPGWNYNPGKDRLHGIADDSKKSS